MKNKLFYSSLNFWKVSSNEWNSIFLKKRTTLRAIPKFSQNFRSIKCKVNFWLSSRNFWKFQLNGSLFRNSKFVETFLWNFSTICHCFEILGFSVEWKVPIVSLREVFDYGRWLLADLGWTLHVCHKMSSVALPKYCIIPDVYHSLSFLPVVSIQYVWNVNLFSVLP